MQTAVPADKARTARPADRLLAAATDLFGKYGIRAVGIDRILREADCAKASLYSAYGSKDGLVIAYLTELDLADRNSFAQALEPVGRQRQRPRANRRQLIREVGRRRRAPPRRHIQLLSDGALVASKVE